MEKFAEERIPLSAPLGADLPGVGQWSESPFSAVRPRAKDLLVVVTLEQVSAKDGFEIVELPVHANYLI